MKLSRSAGERSTAYEGQFLFVIAKFDSTTQSLTQS
jgi:hypothetical protein